jgi:hypothetical protein
MKCKYVELNQKERKCINYYWRHSTVEGCFCRLPEWKRKTGRCPYDPRIHSTNEIVKKITKDKRQQELFK